MRHYLVTLPLLLSILALVSCGGSSDRGPAASPTPSADVALRAAVRADALSRADHTRPFQARMLYDGHVTFAEYRRATHAVVGCLRAFGSAIQIAPIRRAPAGELVFSWTLRRHGPARAAAERRARQAYERCYLAYQKDVATVYANGRVLPPSRRALVLTQLAACLRDAGVPARPTANLPQIMRALDAAAPRGGRCVDQYGDVFRRPDLPSAPPRGAPLED